MSGISSAAWSVWAKHDRGTDQWLPLLRHLRDTKGAAGKVWDAFLPDQVKEAIARGLPRGRADGRELVSWLAAVHDIGKATPAFAVQVHPLAERMAAAGLPFDWRVAHDPDRSLVPHSVAGQILLTDWLTAQFQTPRPVARTYAVVVGGHHGVPPSMPPQCSSRKLMGGDEWRAVQAEILETMAAGRRDRIEEWARHPLPYPVQVLVTAVVIVADWIASNTDYFPYDTVSTPGSPGAIPPSRVDEAWSTLGLPPPWRALPPPVDGEEHFRSRFELPDEARLRPVQAGALDAARAMDTPSLMIIEAPMGEGKTEAALLAAEVLAARFGSGGVFVALPTMATSDAMYGRVEQWLHRLPTAGGNRAQTLFLAHGKAALNAQHSSLPWDDGLHGVDEDAAEESGPTATAVAHSWLRGRKKGVLSSFVVGTIDQVLFGALRSRHLALRHLALAGKVVMIDEVHAVDLYMGSYLTRAVEWLGAYGVPTVLLSATLPDHQRTALAEAYETGRRSAGLPMPAVTAVDRPGYPRIGVSTPAGIDALVPVGSPRASQVHLRTLADDDATLVETLRDLLRDGGCAGVVRNTVRRAQQTAELIRRELGYEVVLLHSRYLAPHRVAREAELRRLLGPPGPGVQRPERLVVVGTQVIEQSLDIDLDVLITDLAPVDLLLQRIGRLHRHRRGDGQCDRPAALRVAVCLITGVRDWSAAPPRAVRGSETVYGTSTLLRALVTLHEHWSGVPITLPKDIPRLVERAYRADPGAPASWQDALDTADAAQRDRDRRQRDRAEAFRLGPVLRAGSSLVGWLAQQVGEAEDRGGQAQVRDADPGLEVIVTVRAADGVHLLDASGGIAGVVPTDLQPSSREAKAAAACTLRLPISVTHPGALDAALAQLERVQYPGWQGSPWLAGQLVLELDAHLGATLAGRRFTYDRQLGLLDAPEHDSEESP